MIALDEMPVSRVAQSTNTDAIKEIINEMFWNWYTTHQNLKITTIKVWIIRKDIYVRDLESLFTLLVGPKKTV